MNPHQQTILGKVMVIVSILTVVTMAVAIDWSASPPRADHCLSEVTESAKVVLVDVSDPLTERQKLDLHKWFGKTVLADLSFNERLMIYPLNGQLRSLPEPILSACRPQLASSEHTTSATDAYLRAHAKDWDLQWKRVFDDALAKASPAPQSPIVEYLTEAMGDKAVAGAQQRKIYLASDLLQNSPNSRWETHGVFRGADVEVMQIARKSMRKKQKEVADWWQRFLREQGATTVVFGPLLEP
jgi:hypothetical protein